MSPDGENHRIGQDGEYEIVEYASGHYQQPLPCRVGTELPFFRGFREVLGVHGFVHHSRNFAIASERKPAYAELGLSPFPFGDGLPSGIEEKIELLHSDSEQFGPHEMSQLMQEDEQGKGKNHLKCFN